MEAVLNNSTSIRMLAIKRLKRKHKTHVGVCMTPMIDIIFLLLTFFVLTANFRKPEDFLSLKLPTAAAAAQNFAIVSPYQIDISAVNAGCVITFGSGKTRQQVTINDGTVNSDLATFAAGLSPALAMQKRTADDPIEISCADDVRWDNLVKIYNIINALGIQDVTFKLND